MQLIVSNNIEKNCLRNFSNRQSFQKAGRTRLLELFKKGDPQQPGNYRPIVLLLIIHKLFSWISSARIKPTLEEAQSADKAVFRASYSCDDHLFTLMYLLERMGEFQLTLRLCAFDFQKAFDTVEHSGLWRALRQQGVNPCYIRTLKLLYKGQSGRVGGTVESKPFQINRGTKQADPLSPVLCNSLLESVLKLIQDKWQSKSYGVQLGQTKTTGYVI